MLSHNIIVYLLLLYLLFRNSSLNRSIFHKTHKTARGLKNTSTIFHLTISPVRESKFIKEFEVARKCAGMVFKKWLGEVR